MIKSLVASKTAKLLAACVCPVAGTVALTTAVPICEAEDARAPAGADGGRPAALYRTGCASHPVDRAFFHDAAVADVDSTR